MKNIQIEFKGYKDNEKRPSTLDGYILKPLPDINGTIQLICDKNSFFDLDKLSSDVYQVIIYPNNEAMPYITAIKYIKKFEFDKNNICFEFYQDEEYLIKTFGVFEETFDISKEEIFKMNEKISTACNIPKKYLK